MWAFMPQYQWLPFWVCFIAESRWPESFFGELGAAISVSFADLPPRASQLRVSSVR